MKTALKHETMGVRPDVAAGKRSVGWTYSRTCPACGASDTRPLADLGHVPVLSGVTFATRAEALASPAAPLDLVFCPACSHVYNAAFDPTLLDYDVDYDNSLHHSEVFQEYAGDLARHLADDYDLNGRHVLEVGCGKGHFLVELCDAANARGTGYDPSFDDAIAHEGVEFVNDYLSWDEAGEFDFFVARHVLEHVAEPLEFLLGLRRACGRQQVCGYIEVPDAIYDFERSPWNCLYPHASYFSATSLARLAIRAGFGLLSLVRRFEGQYLAVELGVNVPTPDHITFTGMGQRRERAILADFRQRYPKMVDAWRTELDAIGPERCVVWGAGAKGLSFLNAIDDDRRIAAVVDLNPAKWTRFLPVTGHEVISPDELRTKDVEDVVITNPAYRPEIERALVELGIDARVHSAH